MRTIHKFPLNRDFFYDAHDTTKRVQTITVPAGSKFLAAQHQGRDICVWMDVDADPDAPKVLTAFAIVGTGSQFTEEFSEDMEYRATVQVGAYVWHIFQAYRIQPV